MKQKSIPFLIILGLILSLPLRGQSPQTNPAYVIPIEGDIEVSTAVFVQRRIQEALEAGADTLIFTLDTFGGRVDSALRIATAIGAVDSARTVAFVSAGSESLGVSWSAGALIALSNQEIYMAPGTSIGAAAPILASPDGSASDAGEKTVSAVRAQMAALAEKNGYPQALALAMVDYDVEIVELIIEGKSTPLLREDAELFLSQNPEIAHLGRTISAPGKLLSLTAGEALRYGLSAGTISSVEELAILFNRQDNLVFLSPNFADQLIVLLTSSAFQSILILAGLVALFLEINSPGFGLPGSIALIAFAILFGSNMLMGTLGSLEIILFILGVGLLVIEIFILPGFGIAGIFGLVLISSGLILSMQDFILPENQWQWDILGENALTVAAGVVMGILVIGLLVATGPKLKLFDRLTLKTAITGTASGRPTTLEDNGQTPDNRTFYPKLGDKGLAVSVLRPSGRAEFKGTIHSVETEGGYIESGTPLQVSQLKGGVIYVKQASGKKSTKKELSG